MVFEFFMLTIFIIWTHFIADFIFQTRWMAENKSSSMKALSLHTLTYGFILSTFMFPYLYVYVYGYFYAVLYLIFNTVAHGITDFLTSRWTSKLYKEGNTSAFFKVIGFDQAIHISTLIGTLYILMVI